MQPGAARGYRLFVSHRRCPPPPPPPPQIVTPKVKGRDETEEIMKIFDLFDEDGSGEISFRKLKRVAVRVRTRVPRVAVPLPKWACHASRAPGVWLDLGSVRTLSTANVAARKHSDVLFTDLTRGTSACWFVRVLLRARVGACVRSRVQVELGENLTDEEMQEMIDEADRNRTGVRPSTRVNFIGLRWSSGRRHCRCCCGLVWCS
jgi:centrin-1